MGNGGREEWGEKRETESWAPYTLGEKRQESDSRSPDTKCQEGQGLCECWKDPSGKQCHCLSVHLVRVLPALLTPEPWFVDPAPVVSPGWSQGLSPGTLGFLKLAWHLGQLHP